MSGFKVDSCCDRVIKQFWGLSELAMPQATLGSTNDELRCDLQLDDVHSLGFFQVPQQSPLSPS
jgi:hypothetical protein